MELPHKPFVSVVIACKNSARHFERCLQSVRAQTYSHIELVVVDNFSSDGTLEIAQRYADTVLQVGPERSTQFNRGFLASRGQLVYRIGPDYVLEPDVIEKCVACIRNGFDAVALHNRSVGDGIWARVRYIERESYRNDATIVAVRFFRREVFEAVGMFDESLVAGEDFDLHNRIVKAGFQWSHVDAVENHVGEPRTIREVWRKFFYYGRTIQRYRNKNRAIAKRQLTLVRPSYGPAVQQALREGILAQFIFYHLVKYAAGAAGMLVGPPRELTPSGRREDFSAWRGA